MVKQSRSPKRVAKDSGKKRNRLLLIPLIALLIKVFIIARIQGFDWYGASGKDLVGGLKLLLDKNYVPSHIWYGADGENYLRSLVGLAGDGFLSKERNLHYWPAGYPLLMWPLLLIFKGSFFFVLSVLQSMLYAFGCAFFVNELRQTRLAKFALPIALILNFNPTLALNTIAIGYEMPTVALTLVAAAALIRNFRLSKFRVFSLELFLAGTSFLLSSLMQPRLIVIAVVFFVIWGLSKFRLKSATLFVLSALLIVSLAPSLMIIRNFNANGFSAISTNLGVTMNIGGGPEATGGYNGKYNGVPCPQADTAQNPAKADNAKVGCIINWYISNPSAAIKLAWNKSIYFWSPWFGPEANGTMARNPWRINHPLAETIKTESGFSLVYGTGGKLLSWTWMLFTLMVMFYGFAILWRAGNLERVLSLVAIATIIVNWLSSVATIGDHRFRIPSMGMSLFLQAVGFTALFLKKKRRLSGTSIPVEWPGLHWKARSQHDNLPS
jgi:hypothetical protein